MSLVMSKPKIYAITGSPVLHSKSPLLFNEAFKKDTCNARYTRIAANSAEEAIFLFKAIGLSGMNVTAPFKEDIIPLLDKIDTSALKIRAVNTVVAEGSALNGYNTDYQGATMSLRAKGIPLEGRRCVVLGAGCAGRAAAFGLKREGAAITIVNRTYAKAVQAAEELDCTAGPIENLSILLNEVDIIVSALSSRAQPVKEKWLRKDHIVLDANYPESSLYEVARKRGCLALKGEDWLLHQALPAYRLFTGCEPDAHSLESSLFCKDTNSSKKANLTLIGFMGSGKSRIGEKLARKMGLAFRDTDLLIEKKEQKTIPAVFRTKGEGYFREMEKVIMKEMAETKGIVYACGGGSICDPENREVMAEHSTVIWLYASLPTCLMRVEAGSRPLLDGMRPMERAKELFHNRLPYYAGTAYLVINSENDEDRVVQKIFEEMHQTIHR